MTEVPQLPEWLDRPVEDDFLDLLSLLEGKEESRVFCRAFFTKRELFLIACRARATTLLYDGFNTVQARQLCQEKPNISRGVVSRANSEIVKGDDGAEIKQLYQRLKAFRSHGL